MLTQFNYSWGVIRVQFCSKTVIMSWFRCFNEKCSCGDAVKVLSIFFFFVTFMEHR